MKPKLEHLFWPATLSLAAGKWAGKLMTEGLKRSETAIIETADSVTRLLDRGRVSEYLQQNHYQLERAGIERENKERSRDATLVMLNQQRLVTLTRTYAQHLIRAESMVSTDFADQVEATLSQGAITQDDYELVRRLRATNRANRIPQQLTSADIPVAASRPEHDELTLF